MYRKVVRRDIREAGHLWRQPDDVIQRSRAKTRHRRAEMLELVGSGCTLNAFDNGYCPVIAREPADHATEPTPTVERRRRMIDLNAQRAAPLFREMKAVARRAAGQASRKR